MTALLPDTGEPEALTPGERADRAVAGILTSLDTAPGRGVVVDSPPGAGKSTLVVKATGHLTSAGHQLMIVAQTNEQVDDLVDRIAREHPGLALGRLHASGHVLPPRVTRHPNVTGSNQVTDLRDLPVVVSTAKKWSFVTPDKCTPWRWAIVDEAYQMRSDGLLATAPLFAQDDSQVLFVGDPGQLDPFATVETDRWHGLTWDPLRNAVDVTLAHNPDLLRHQLPVSWRLPETAAPLVEEAFYPFYRFVPGTTAPERVLSYASLPHGSGPPDDVLARAADSGWGYLELPARHTLDHDPEVADALVATAARLLERGALVNGERLTADRFAIGTARTVQADAVRSRLAACGLTGITVDTANRLQGREFDVTLVWHPLSGRQDASTFHLETGRLCVLLSRHRFACIVVARAGIRDLLDQHPRSNLVYLDVPPKFPDGWRAHQVVMGRLEQGEHRVRTT
ncbi:helicase [Streptomyces chrestomyceticus JCM 4735]|uniref:Helicase n=1 Tax=Streptomyces chrestomyceticus JCM 4735 TaxID=1306181 RepID=A0A7U9PVW2_9ACTN|nr:AAA family ATPase [Streptomyces chrestomyceticus]GCD33608.1 helicase [Streptomyces chrestomyceticus JCM 4735]